ncbi:helix-turn-helix domain-containing protein [Fusobacterium polymorphum]|uniref:helix-turn-helix domain-containing protein n=1 Tax=Fusobacterium TaxID=848 RepID=UPI00093FB962|nr:helix-turn-helix transcriptional regulator [Fusobacterium massiliense]
MIKFKIHILMAEKRMTQKDVMEATGITTTVMNKYYYGTIVRIPTLHIDKLCKLFNCQPNDLFEYIPDDEKNIQE